MTGFWLYRIGQKNGQVAIIKSIWCGTEAAADDHQVDLVRT